MSYKSKQSSTHSQTVEQISISTNKNRNSNSNNSNKNRNSRNNNNNINSTSTSSNSKQLVIQNSKPEYIHKCSNLVRRIYTLDLEFYSYLLTIKTNKIIITNTFMNINKQLFQCLYILIHNSALYSINKNTKQKVYYINDLRIKQTYDVLVNHINTHSVDFLDTFINKLITLNQSEMKNNTNLLTECLINTNTKNDIKNDTKNDILVQVYNIIDIVKNFTLPEILYNYTNSKYIKHIQLYQLIHTTLMDTITNKTHLLNKYHTNTILDNLKTIRATFPDVKELINNYEIKLHTMKNYMNSYLSKSNEIIDLYKV